MCVCVCVCVCVLGVGDIRIMCHDISCVSYHNIRYYHDNAFWLVYIFLQAKHLLCCHKLHVYTI